MRPLEEHPVARDVERARELLQADVHLAAGRAGSRSRVCGSILMSFRLKLLELHLLLEALVEVLDDLLAHLAVVGAREEAHLAQRPDEAVGVAPDDALEELGDALAHLRRELGHRAEIEQHELAVGADQHVPGVRIGVVDAVDEDHLADRPCTIWRASSLRRCPARRAPRGRRPSCPRRTSS